MRHCFSEVPNVFESENKSLSELLRGVADTVDETDGSWHNLTVHSTTADDGSPIYRADLYVH